MHHGGKKPAQMKLMLKQLHLSSLIITIVQSLNIYSNIHHYVFVQDRPERQWLLPIPPHSCDSEWNDAGVWRKHTQRHIHEPRCQVLLRRLPSLQSGSVTRTTAAAPTVFFPSLILLSMQDFSLHCAALHSYSCTDSHLGAAQYNRSVLLLDTEQLHWSNRRSNVALAVHER